MKKTYGLIAAILTLSLGSSSGALAGEFVIGRYAGEFLALGAGARALAMGGASVALPSAATAGYYNPSALAGLGKREVEFMHASQFENLFTYDFLSYAKPMRQDRAGAVTLLYSRVDDIPITRLEDPNAPFDNSNRVVKVDETGDHEMALLASVGQPTAGAWRLGANAKLLYKTVADESAFGLGFDIGVGRTLARGLEFGAVARDITTSVLAWSTGRTESLLPSVVVGGSWEYPLSALDAAVNIVADFEGHFEDRGAAETVEAGPLTVEPHLGLEYEIVETVALRGGLNGERPTFGAGLRIALLSINAAFEDHEDLGLTHRVSLNVTW